MFLYQPPQPERKIKAMQGKSPLRKFESTLDYLSRGGLPVNPVVLNGIKHKLKSGAYRENRADLIKAVKADPSLYVYSVKNLHKFIDQGGPGILPEEGLESLSEDKLVKLFDVTEGDISIHRVRNMSGAQALRLQHSIISSNTAETLAESIDLNSQVAYSTALLRQLGLNLIAWNYPEQYAKALRVQKKGQGTLEEELERLLGVTPLEIAERLAGQWELHPEIRHAVSYRPQAHRAVAGEEPAALHLGEICTLAELFAKANDTGSYPGCDEAWALIEPEVKKNFGSEVLNAVAEKVEHSLERYEEAGAPRFKPALFNRPEPFSVLRSFGRELLRSNPFAHRCPPSTQKLVEAVYERIDSEAKVSVDALRVLVDTVVTQLGFVRGCLYVFDERRMMVTPALRIGDIPLESYESFKMHQNNLITTSLDSVVPVMQGGVAMDGIRRMRMAGGLGAKKPPAVLYLEVDDNFFESSEHDPLLSFHCLRYCFMHCLGLEPSRTKSA